MSMQQIIRWRKDMARSSEGMTFANVHLLVCYNQRTIADYQEMAALLRKTFPQAKDDEIVCGNVRMSATVDGASIIAWNAYIPKGEYPGWDQTEEDCEYCWQ